MQEKKHVIHHVYAHLLSNYFTLANDDVGGHFLVLSQNSKCVNIMFVNVYPLRPGEVYVRQWIKSSLVQAMTCRQTIIWTNAQVSSVI